jgi:hypothetical protein
MRVMFNINAGSGEAQNATELKEKLEALMNELGLEGSTRGDEYGNRASYNGSYRSPSQSDNDDD